MGYQKFYEEQYRYLLDCMNPDSFEDAKPEEKLKHFFQSFESEFCSPYNCKRWPVPSQRIAEYLKGLPSSCSVDYTDYDIFLIGQKWGYVSKDINTDNLDKILADKETETFIILWWSHLANRLLEMADYYEIEIPY